MLSVINQMLCMKMKNILFLCLTFVGLTRIRSHFKIIKKLQS